MACSTDTENYTLIKEAQHLLFIIGEILVDESKGHYTPEVAVDEIRNLLRDNQEVEKKLIKVVMEMNDNEQT